MGLEHKLSEPAAWRSASKAEENGLGVRNSNIEGKNGRGQAANGLGNDNNSMKNGAVVNGNGNHAAANGH